MQSIGTGLQTDIDHGSGLPAVFCRRILDHIEFLDGVDRQNGGGISGDSSAVDNALARKGFAIEKAIDQVGVVLGAQSVAAGGGEAAARIANHAGSELQQVFIVATIQGKVVNFLIAEGSTEGRGGAVEHRNVTSNRDHNVRVTRF